MKKAVYLVLALLLAFGVLLSACQPTTPTTTAPKTTTVAPTTTSRPTVTATTAPPAGTPQYGGILRVTTGAAPSTLLSTTQNIKQFYAMANFDTLLKLNEKGELQPNLATDWKFSSDFKALTLTLRRGVKYHDGTDFNAAAVKFSLQLRKDAKLGDYEDVTSIDVIDDYTLRLNLAKYTNTLTNSLWFYAGMPISPTAYNLWGPSDARWHPVGTGPFKFVNYEMNQIIRYTRNDAYWQQGKPYLDGFYQSLIAESTIRELAVRRGEFDAVEALTPMQIDGLQKDGWPSIKGTIEMWNSFAADTANQDSPLGNLKVREAIDHAIDRAAVVKAQGYGLMQVMNQNAPEGSYAYDPALKGRAYDTAKAKQLLTEAGYPNGFKTTLLTVYSIADQLIAAQSYLKAVGIEAPIDLADRGRYLQFAQGGWKNQLIYRAYRMSPDWLNTINMYMSSITTECKSMARPAGWQDLLDKALTATDAASKATAAKAVNKMLYDQEMHIALWGTFSPIVTGKNVRNMEYYAPWGANKYWTPADVWLSK